MPQKLKVGHFINKNYEKSANLLSPTNIPILHTQGMKDGTLVDRGPNLISEGIRFITLDPVNMGQIAFEGGEGAFR